MLKSLHILLLLFIKQVYLVALVCGIQNHKQKKGENTDLEKGATYFLKRGVNTCVALWARMSGFCVVASQNHANMGDSISIGALLFCIKSSKYRGGCPSKMSDSILRVIGILLLALAWILSYVEGENLSLNP